MTSLDVDDGVDRYVHAYIAHIRDTTTLTFHYGQLDSGYNISLSTSTSTIEGNESIECEVAATQSDGDPVAGGTRISWSIDNSDYGNFLHSQTTIVTRTISNEEQTARDIKTVSVKYPISSVSSVTLKGGGTNYYTGGSSFDGRVITLTTALPHNDSIVWVNYVAGGISTNTLTGNNGAIIESEIDIHATVSGRRDSATITFKPASAAENARIRLKATGSVIEGIETIDYEAIVTDSDGSLIDNGTSISWTLDDDTYGKFLRTTTTTTTKSITSEEAVASSKHEITTDYPISAVSSVQLRGGSSEYYTEGSSFNGTTITLATALPYNDSIVIVNYTGGGVATNILTAGSDYPVDTYIHAFSFSVRDSVQITFNEPDIGSTDDAFVTIVAKDRNTGDVLIGASVWIDDVLKGVTDDNGQLYIGLVTVGQHTVKITMVDYDPTNEDFLQNDTFIV
jgi:hypothetical protein